MSEAQASVGGLKVEASAAEAAASFSSSSSAAAASPVAAPASGKKGKKSKKAVAKAEEEESATNLATVDHPYLSFLHKRIRSYKKKLEKIKGLESARAADGKVLNPQQLELVASKPGLEKLIVEFETLREQFVEVYLQEEAAKKAADEDKAAALIDVVLEATAPEAELAPEPQTVEGPRDEFAHVGELLKALHAVTLHQALGKDVPMVLDFFSKVLLGNTRPPAEVSYSENLAESLEQAKKFLANSDELFACDMTYAGLREMVDELDRSAAAPATEAAEPAEDAPADEQAAGELPQINFFTDSQLEPEDVAPPAQDDASEEDEAVADVEQEVIADVVAETITTEETVTLEPVIVEPPPSALPMPIPPKSFAAVASGGSASPTGSNRSPSPTAGDSSSDARGKSGSQRRRGAPRWKKESSISSNGKGDGSDGAKTGKPRRPRPSRAAGESAGDKSSSRGAAKDKDRRPRAEFAFRKPSAQPAPLAPNA